MQCVPVGCWIIPSSALHNKNSPKKCPPKVTYQYIYEIQFNLLITILLMIISQ